MNTLLKALLALVVGYIAYLITAYVLRHFSIDQFWAVIVGVIVGVAYYLNGPFPV